jgi:hypothetical protein
MVSNAGGAATEHSADPELIVSFGVANREILFVSFTGRLQAPVPRSDTVKSR